MTDKNLTGPELISRGQEYLRKAERQWEDAPDRKNYTHEENWQRAYAACMDGIQSCAAIAAAAFAGANAAAFGQLAADAAHDEGDTVLAAAWATAVGARAKDAE